MKIITGMRLARGTDAGHQETASRDRHSIRNKATYYCSPATE